MKRVEILGPDGAQGAALRAAVESAIAAVAAPVELVEVRDMDLITSYRVMNLPALVIDERVRAVGRVPTPAQILAWLREP